MNAWERITDRLSNGRWDPTAWARDTAGTPTRDLSLPLSRVSVLAAIYLEADDLFDAHELSLEFLGAMEEIGVMPDLIDHEEEMSHGELREILRMLRTGRKLPPTPEGATV